MFSPEFIAFFILKPAKRKEGGRERARESEGDRKIHVSVYLIDLLNILNNDISTCIKQNYTK